MTCDDVLRALAGSAAPSRAVRDHAASCATCGPLVAADDALRAEPHTAPQMSSALREALAAHQRVGVPYTPARRALAPAGAAVAALGLVALCARRPDFTRVPAWLVLVCGAGFVGAFAAGLALVLVRGRTGRGASGAARGAYLVVAALAYVALTVLAVDSVPGSQPQRPIQGWLAREIVPIAGTWVRHLPCTIFGLVVGGTVAALVLRAAARTAIVAPRLSGAVCGATAAMATAFVLFAYCPSHTVFHVTFVHAIPLVAVVAAGAHLGRRALAP